MRLSTVFAILYILSITDWFRLLLAHAGYPLFILGVQPNFLASILIILAASDMKIKPLYYILFALIWGIGGEFTQRWIGKVFDLFDMLATVLGIITGLVIKYYQKNKPV